MLRLIELDRREAIDPRSVAQSSFVKDQSRNDITNLIRLLEDLGKKAAGRGDEVNEAYLNGLAEGLALADMVNHDQVQVMTRWSQILANQQIRSTSVLPTPHRSTTKDARPSAY